MPVEGEGKGTAQVSALALLFALGTVNPALMMTPTPAGEFLDALWAMGASQSSERCMIISP